MNHHLIACEVDNKIVSSCVGVSIPNLTRNARSYAFAENVVAHGDYRKKGYTAASLNCAKQIAMESNCYKIVLSAYSFGNGGCFCVGKNYRNGLLHFMCAPFFIIGYYNKNSKEPMNFWSGDKKLKGTVKNVQGYNDEMSKLYIRCALVFAATGAICLIYPDVGVCFILLECTLGIYVVWKIYQSILLKYL